MPPCSLPLVGSEAGAATPASSVTATVAVDPCWQEHPVLRFVFVCPGFMKSLLLMITYKGTLVQHENRDLEVLLSLTQWLGSQGGGMAENLVNSTPSFPGPGGSRVNLNRCSLYFPFR